MKKILVLLALVAILVVSMTSAIAAEAPSTNPQAESTVYSYVQPMAIGCWYSCSWCPHRVCTASASCC